MLAERRMAAAAKLEGGGEEEIKYKTKLAACYREEPS